MVWVDEHDRWRISGFATNDDEVANWIIDQTDSDGRFKSESELLLTLVRQEMQREALDE